LQKSLNLSEFGLLWVLICPYIALKKRISASRSPPMPPESTFPACNLCVKNPNAIALPESLTNLAFSTDE